MRPLGLVVVAVALAAPLYWFVGLGARHDPIAVFSQYMGSAALIAMGISQLLATRWRALETVFGGLDRIYVLHKWLGIGALAAVLLHDTIDADIDGLGVETVLTETAETFGEISLYGILVLVTLTLATFVPYHLWRWTHKFIGGFFALSAFHYIFILKPFDLADPLGIYVLCFCILGIGSYAYTLKPIGRLRSRHRYEVAAIRQTGDALAVSLMPRSTGIRHRPGQFAFVSFDQPGLREAHPFTISKAPDDDRSLRFTVKPLGDFTARLGGALTIGAPAQVSGPYGHFRPGNADTAQVWIAAGIGITPFMAWAEALGNQPGEVHLFYCVRHRENAAHLDDLAQIDARTPGFHLHVVETSTQGRLTADQIADRFGARLQSARVSFCGPAQMRNDLRKSLRSHGLPSSRFLYEEFEIRSGLEIGKAVAWLLKGLLSARARRTAREAYALPREDV